MVRTIRRSYFGVFTVIAAIALLCVLAGSSGAAVGDTTRVSVVDGSGAEANGHSFIPSTSSDGRYVAFESLASNLVAGDTNGITDIFAHDRQSGKTQRVTERVSVDESGNRVVIEANAPSFNPSIGADGRYVAFTSDASNLVADDANSYRDVFVHDLQTGTTRRVSVDSSGAAAIGDSFSASISANGRYVAFISHANNLVANDTTANFGDVFVHDRDTDNDNIMDEPGAINTERVSVDSSEIQANGGSSDPRISPDGGYVAFHSGASNLVAGDTNGFLDVFVRDRAAGTTQRVSVAGRATQANNSSFGGVISANGRHVAFTSDASNLVKDDTANGFTDVFVRDLQARTTERVSVAAERRTQALGQSIFPSISANGCHVAFFSNAFNIVPGDTVSGDVFVRDRTTGTTQRVSVDSSGAQANDQIGVNSSISADGRYVAFASSASNLVAGDINGLSDVFVHERQANATQSSDCRRK